MAFESLSEKLNAAFKKLRGKGRLSPADVKDAMREVRMALLEADVSYKVVKDFVKNVTEKATGADVLEALSPAQMIVKIVNQELCELMGGQNQKLNISSKLPSVVMLVGLQGAGKTTNGAKLAGYMKKQGKRPLLAACDIYRPAAIKQLETVGAQLDIPVFQMWQIGEYHARNEPRYRSGAGCACRRSGAAGRPARGRYIHPFRPGSARHRSCRSPARSPGRARARHGRGHPLPQQCEILLL